ncbi:hypothetical protein RND81_11G174800 [Saponaria officinalis]|uniref:Dof zinc finger protein n=1 Tax=Saponaria officinalis TaxID=3572 RepID=A0AAW1HNV5_SAPOF
MDASRVQRHQDIMASQSLDSMLVCTKPQNQQQQQQEKKPRPSEEALKCPRCDSSNTKFCYYNNYSLTQPRYFCKSCRRYWTKGGTLRNVPVGGGCRKNKRCSRRTTPDHLQSYITSPTSSISPLTSYEHYNDHHHHLSSATHDLTLAFANHNGNIPILGNTHFDLFGNQFNHGHLLDSLRNGFVNHENNNNNNNNNQQRNGVNMYYGANLGDVDNNVNTEEHQMGMHFDLLQLQNQQEIMSNASSGSSTPTIKQEMGHDNNNNRGILSYIMTGGGEIDTHRESWNAGVLAPSWHNLLNSPLM